MDKFVTRTKRKSPSPPIPTSTTKSDKSEVKKVQKKAKKEEKLKKKDAKPKKEEETEDAKMKKILSKEGRMSPKGTAMVDFLPTIRREPGKAMSDADLEKLFLAICGNTGKDYDSDDSIISEIDFMDAEEIAAKDKVFREVMESIEALPQQMKTLFQIRKIGNETQEEKEKRRRLIRDIHDKCKTKEEKEASEKQLAKRRKKLERRLNTVVQVFDIDVERVEAIEDAPPFITARQMARILEVMAEVVPEDIIDAEGQIDYRKTIKKIDSEILEKRIKNEGISGGFYREDKSMSEYLKKKVRKMLKDDQFIDVIDRDRYDFDFTTKDVVLALENYYNLNKPAQGDNGKSAAPLAISIRLFVKSCYYVAKHQNSNFVINENLRQAMFG